MGTDVLVIPIFIMLCLGIAFVVQYFWETRTLEEIEMMEKVGKTRVIACILLPSRSRQGETHVSYPDGETEKFISARVSFYETNESPKVVYQNRDGSLGADIYLTKEQLLLVVNAYLKNF